MARNTHDMALDHHGTAVAEEIATGTATAGYVPVSAGAGVAAAWSAPPASASVLWKDPVRAATSAAGTLATSFANGSAIDGVTLATGDRILLKDQATASENGIYVVAASGAPARATDADTGAKIAGASVLVREGTLGAHTIWSLSTAGTITLGSTSLAFAQTAGYFTRTAAQQWLTFAGGYNEIRAGDGSGGFYTDAAYSQMWSNGGIEVTANNGVAGGAASAKHFLYGGNGLVLPVLAADPSGANSEQGQVYFNSTTHKARCYDGTTWWDLF